MPYPEQGTESMAHHQVFHPVAQLVNEQDGEVVHCLPKLNHLHVPMHICRQGGTIKDKVIHHHIQGQPWSPVRDGFIQGV